MSSLVLPLVLTFTISLFLLRRPLLRIITPRDLPGIPAYPDPSPMLGDIPRMRKMMKSSGGFGDLADACARELGAIAQLRVGFFSKYALIPLLELISVSSY